MSTCVLEENAIEIHRWLLLLVAVFASAFSIVSFLLCDIEQATVSILGVIGSFIAHLIHRRGFLYGSKLFNAIQIIIMLATISLLTGLHSLAFMYFFPVLISVLLAFQGSEKKTGYVLIVIILVFLGLSTVIPEPLSGKQWDSNHLILDRSANIIGVAISCIVILLFLIKTMNKVQQHLIENSNISKENNAKLVAADYSRNQLMSVISHDLRAPMAGAIMTVEACLKEDTSEESKKEMLRTLKSKASQILIMIDQLLDWSRSQTGNLTCNIAPIPVEHFESYTNKWTNLVGESKNIHFTTEFDFKEGETVSCDKNMIETSLRNLISNAVKFSINGNTIHIRSKIFKNKRTFEVEDFGKGITPAQMKKLNEGVSMTTRGTNNEKGNGFGLQLVQEFLRRHNSHLEIHSEFGKGSLFSFKL
jgi:signal transduction histidine kinase